MDTPEFPKSFKILVPTFVLVAVLTVIMPRYGEFEYQYRKGSRWNYETLVAPFDFPVLKTADQIKNEKEKMGGMFVPYYRYSSTVFDGMSKDIRIAVPDSIEWVAREIIGKLEPYYQRGVLPDEMDYDIDSAINTDILFVLKDKQAYKTVREELYPLKTVKTALSNFIFSMDTSVTAALNVDSLLAKTSFYEMIVPNLIYDKSTAERVHNESIVEVSPTSGIFRAGDVIVESSEIVTADIEQILDSYKAEFENSVGYNGPDYLIWTANFLISLILSGMVLILIMFTKPSILKHSNEYMFILCVFLLACVSTFLFNKFPERYIYLMPYPVFALFYQAFFRKKVVLPLYALSLLPILVFCQDGAQLYVMHLFAGVVAIYAFTYFNRGWRQFLAALFIFFAMFLVYFTFVIRDGAAAGLNYREILFLFLGSLSCVLTYQLIYLFEIAFGLVSVSRLVELSDTSSPLIRLLADKAPGTFQHSLAVMNMADAAGRSVDANVPLLRAAALYHDVGKIQNPVCFIENQTSGGDYHQNLTPEESASEIIHHVTDGLSIAEKYGVPPVIREFISTHHGTTSTGYFYTKYLNAGGNAENSSAFFYPGPRPQTKEQVILMLCDALEAASRTIRDYSAESVSDFVDSIYETKKNEGQFDDAVITLKELGQIRSVLKDHIVQAHHGRIIYPKRKI